MNPLINECPVCHNELSASRLQCQTCGTSIEGIFNLESNPFSKLNPDQLQFALNFVRFEGRMNRLEDELKMSYPTLRNRLLDIIHTLGFEAGKEELAVKPDEKERNRILADLEKGVIDVAEAQRRLAGDGKLENNDSDERKQK
jgi:hypothetical protein